MTVLYITYIDFSSCDGGNYIRPARMYNALKQEGHNVYLLSGEQEKGTWKERKRKVAEAEKWLDSHTPDICYIESPVYPIMLACDCRLIRRVHRMGIPIGYFYRDFYRMFPQLYPRRTGLQGSLKELLMDVLQRRTDRLLRCADIVYFPSQGCTELFPYADMRALPPAGEDKIAPFTGEKNTCIYVGGLTGHYGGEFLLDTFRRLNENGEYRLIMVCRENEWTPFRADWEREPWLEVHHASGKELEPLYRRASLALLPIQPNVYTDLAVNIKLFEYMGYGLPVVSTNAREIARLIRENGIGLSTEKTDTEEYARLIRDLLEDEERLARLRENTGKALRSANMWIHRAEKVVSDLSSCKKA